jgi:hypothetical protein
VRWLQLSYKPRAATDATILPLLNPSNEIDNKYAFLKPRLCLFAMYLRRSWEESIAFKGQPGGASPRKGLRGKFWTVEADSCHHYFLGT